MWNSLLYTFDDQFVDYQYYHLFHSDNVYDNIHYFEFKNDTMIVKYEKTLKTYENNSFLYNQIDDFKELSKIIHKENKMYNALCKRNSIRKKSRLSKAEKNRRKSMNLCMYDGTSTCPGKDNIELCERRKSTKNNL